MRRQVPRSPVNTRRRPQQSRARQTSRALQDAFVRLLTEQDYDTITIREIVNVAGTGLGSFYEYFASKEHLARVCIHLRTKALLLIVRATRSRLTCCPLATMVQAVAQPLLSVHRDQPAQWAVHYFLERKLSDVAAYSKMYERFVQEWVRVIELISDRICTSPIETARTCQTITYALFSHTHIRSLAGAGPPDLECLSKQLRFALTGYLQVATDPVAVNR